MSTVVVYGLRDPLRFAGFPDFESFIAYLESELGSNSGDPSDQDSPTPPDPSYEVDPALETLMRSPEFHKLNQAVKTEILKDQNLTEAFAKFLNDGGTFVLNSSIQLAIWDRGPPPFITLPNSFLNPGATYVDRAVFALAHEIYHNEFQHYFPGGTWQQWAHNEAVATLQAYRAVERMGLDLDTDGLGHVQGIAVSLIRNSANDAEAMQKLEEHYLDNTPG